MPCKEFVHAARNSTLMIHEATLDDDHLEDAIEKGHSTFSQAVDAGYQARARNLLLTHFSQRYPRTPRLRHGPSANGADPDIAIGFDLMSIKIKDMWRMQYYLDAFEVMFPPEEVEVKAAAKTNGRNEMPAPPRNRRQWSPSRYTPPPSSPPQSSKQDRKKQKNRGKPGSQGQPPQRSPIKRSHSPLASDSSKRSRTDMDTS